MNLFSGIGRLTKDVDLRVTQNNISVASGTIAIDRPFKNSNGEREVDFIRFVAFRKTAELLNQHFSKGDELGVNGRIQTRNYEDKSGNRVYVTELVIENFTFTNGNNKRSNNGHQNNNHSYGPPVGGEARGSNSKPQQSNMEENPFQSSNGPVDIDDSDLPF